AGSHRERIPNYFSTAVVPRSTGRGTRLRPAHDRAIESELVAFRQALRDSNERTVDGAHQAVVAHREHAFERGRCATFYVVDVRCAANDVRDLRHLVRV